MDRSKAQIALTISLVLGLSACSGLNQVSQMDVKKTAENAQQAITALANSKDGLLTLKDDVSQTLTAVKAGDYGKAQQQFSKVQETWKGLEGALKTVSSEKTAEAQTKIETVGTELKAAKPDAAKITAHLQDLGKSISGFAVGGGAMLAPDAQSSLKAMEADLEKAAKAVDAENFSAAKTDFGNARQAWFKFGGSVKQQSAETYQKLDNGVKTAHAALNAANPQKDAVANDIKTLSTELQQLSGNN